MNDMDIDHTLPGGWKFRAVLLTLLFCTVPLPAIALDGHLNVNTATLGQLKMLPYVGDSRARAILAYRRDHGSFATPDDLRKAGNVGKDTYDAIRPYVVVSGPTTLSAEREAAYAEPECRDRFLSTRPGEIRVLEDKAYFGTLLAFMRGARDRIDVAMFLFKTTTSPKNRPARLVRELIEARQRGVEVTVLLEKSRHDPGINDENGKVAKALEDAGVNVIFDSPRVTTHTKTIVIDGRYSFVGSHNFTHSALFWNHEVSLLIDSRETAGELLQYLDKIGRG